MITIVYNTKKENSSYKKHIEETIGLKDYEILELIIEDESKIPYNYNKILPTSKYNYVLFCDDNIKFETNNWGRKLIKHFERNQEYGVIGILGVTDLVSGNIYDIRKSINGVISYVVDNKKQINYYSSDQGNKIKEVVALSNRFLVIDKGKIKHNFIDNSLYDLSFSFINYLNGVKIGLITDVRIIDNLNYLKKDIIWEKQKLNFEEKFKNDLPKKLTNNKSINEKLIFNPESIGVGMVTYNAEHRIVESAPLIPKWVKHFVIVNDGTPYPAEIYPKHAHIIQHEKNECVGKSKSDAIKWLMDRGVEHIFIIEDDVLIKNEKVFEEYIKHSVISGIKHLNYGLQGPANRKGAGGFSTLEERAKLKQNGDPNPRQIVKYENGVEIALYPNCVGSFSYYHRDVIEKIGGFDPNFKNAWEHVEHTYVAFKNGFTTPFWWFADINKSWEYLKDIDNCIENSTIAHTPEWNENFHRGTLYYKNKHGIQPTQTPDTKPEEINKIINHLYANR